jgi:transposase
MSRVMAGIDLHSNNVVVGIVDTDGARVAQKKLPCELKKIAEFLSPFRDRLEQVAVESTFNWYWLVDGLQAAGFPVVLADPGKIEQYRGIKHGDDVSDAFFLAELSRLKILPTSYVYDATLRPVRDLLRRRMLLVHHRTALMLSFKSLYTRTTGQAMSVRAVKRLEPAEAQKLYEHPANQLIAGMEIEHVEQLSESISRIEKAVLRTARKLPYYPKLNTLPGIGIILALTITMEVGDIKRFADAGRFASYCRTVDAQRFSNGRKKGENNQKCGNRYLSWAFIEAANFAKRFDTRCGKWFERKKAKTNTVIATKSLACKLAKAAWYVMAKETNYDPQRIFPELKKATT